MRSFFRWSKNGEEEKKTKPEVTDPTANQTYEDNIELGYEWVYDEYSSDDVKTWRDPESPYEYRGFRIEENNGRFFYVPQGDSPVQSSIDFLGAGSRLEDGATTQRYQRAFDFNKTLREVGDVRPILGGQTPHWVGMPQVSLTKYITEDDRELLSFGWNSKYSLPSEGHIGVGVNMDVVNRPPSPPSCMDITAHERESSGIRTTSTPRTRYSLLTDGLNPFHLVGDDATDTEEDTSGLDVISEDPQAKSNITNVEHYDDCGQTSTEQQGMFSYPEAITQSSPSPPLRQPSRPGHRRFPLPENVAFNQNLSEWAQFPIHLPEKTYTPLELESILDEIYGRASNTQESPEVTAGTSASIPLPHPFFTPLPQHLHYGAEATPNAENVKYAVPPQEYMPNHFMQNLGGSCRVPGNTVPVSSHQKIFTQGKNQTATVLEETLNQQIADVESQLMFAYDKLERSEIEKRRLVQQLSYLRLMELELDELQALTRIVNSAVPAEEDIQILDRIIHKLRGHQL